jgi:2,3-bisphosphoglycerate-dependent phosphoglycerate mutase
MMRNALLFFIVILGLNTTCTSQNKDVTTFILVRHAEKGSDGTEDPDLKPEGAERAKRLAAMLKETKIDAIYATKFKRTKNTVTPTAESKSLVVKEYEAHKPEVIEAMIKEHRGGTILLSGHSNTIPWTINLLIGKEEYKDFQDTDYDNFVIVDVVEKGKNAKVTWLNY